METISSSVLDEVVERLVKEFQPEEIYLFGSQAWGKPTVDSDVDIFVIVEQSDESPVRRSQRAYRRLGGLGLLELTRRWLSNAARDLKAVRIIADWLTHGKMCSAWCFFSVTRPRRTR